MIQKMLIRRYKDEQCPDKEIIVTIGKTIDSSVELRNEKELDPTIYCIATLKQMWIRNGRCMYMINGERSWTVLSHGKT